MYCGKCGIKIDYVHSFCPACGEPISPQGTEVKSNTFNDYMEPEGIEVLYDEPRRGRFGKFFFIFLIALALCSLLLVAGYTLYERGVFLEYGLGDTSMTYGELLSAAGMDSDLSADDVRASYRKAVTVKFNDKLYKKNGVTSKEAEITVPDMEKIYHITTEEKEVIRYINNPTPEYTKVIKIKIPVDESGKPTQDTVDSVEKQVDKEYNGAPIQGEGVIANPTEGEKITVPLGMNDDLVSQSNANASSRAVRNGDFYFFVQADGIIRTDENGKNAQRVSENKGAHNLYKDQDWIYYLTAPSEGNGSTEEIICRVNKDGSKEEVFENCKAKAFVIDGSNIYFTAEDGIWKCSLNGTSEKKIVSIDNGKLKNNIFVLDGRMYYQVENTICRASVNGKDERTLLKEENGIDAFTMTGAEIFVQEKSTGMLYACDLFGDEAQEIVKSDLSGTGVVYKGILYAESGTGIVGIDLNKGTTRSIGKGSSVSVMRSILYYRDERDVIQKIKLSDMSSSPAVAKDQSIPESASNSVDSVWETFLEEEIYKEDIQGYSKNELEYVIFDINKDSVPELLIKAREDSSFNTTYSGPLNQDRF